MFNPFEGAGILIFLVILPYLILRCIGYLFNLIGRFFDWLADKYVDKIGF
jgi:hypothetical protein